MADTYPVLPLRDIVVFPQMIVPLFVGRDKSVAALESAMAGDKTIFLVAQLDPGEDDPDAQERTPECARITGPELQSGILPGWIGRRGGDSNRDPGRNRGVPPLPDSVPEPGLDPGAGRPAGFGSGPGLGTRGEPYPRFFAMMSRWT